MKLYCDPISTTSRPVMMLVREHNLPVEFVHVDLMSGAHLEPEYLSLNPNGIVPFLVDGDLRLGESAAILKYLASKFALPAYPADLAARAQVDEALSWFGTHFHEYFCLFVCYPNMGVPHGLDPELGKQLMAYGRSAAPRWLKVLDEHMLTRGPYVCGDTPTVADYQGLSFVMLGELADFDFSPYPNVRAWLARMQDRPAFETSYAAFRGLVAFLKASEPQAA